MKWSEKLTSEIVLKLIREDTSKQHHTQESQCILTRNYLLHGAYGGQMTKVKGVGRRCEKYKILKAED